MLSRLAVLVPLILSISTPSAAYWKGFNLPANLPSGACKTTQDWARDFSVLKSLPGQFTSARLFASSDCGTLANAVPAALASNAKLLVGVWATDNAHYEAEKTALLQAIQQHGTGWIIAVSVGSEDLYRGDTSAGGLASQIREVKSLLCERGACGIQVGHVDTWTAWVDPKNEDVIRACDFVGHDGYPYWEGVSVEQGLNAFRNNLEKTRNAVNRVKPGTWVWVTETGWPVTGASFGLASPSVANAQAYWKSVACESFRGAHTFWYTTQDYASSPSFGVLGPDFKSLYDLSC
ncbi:MAG: hypothetical protein L6R38_009056 [Xanthoria sp. 2 TBL-2021]|nr:MAG: hypothetical protein L6R38_009056 [Xanthoria sp. 2 TBL-2021]